MATLQIFWGGDVEDVEAVPAAKVVVESGVQGPPGADGGLSGDIALAVGTTTITGGTTARLLSVGADNKLAQTNPDSFDAAGTAAAAVTAHLGGDQHPQYVLADGTRDFAGDLVGAYGSRVSLKVGASLTNDSFSVEMNKGEFDSGAKLIFNPDDGLFVSVRGKTFSFGAAGELQGATLDFSNVINPPTTLSGYGITDAVASSLVGAKNGVASLDSSGQVPAAQIPAIAITEYLGQVASQAAMLALSGQKGDWCIRTDSGAVWIITGDNPTLLASWTQVSYPASPVSSVAGRTGDVTLSAADVDGLSKVATTNSYLDLSNIPTEFTPASHSHGNITNVGAIGSTSGQFVTTGASGVLEASTPAAAVATLTQFVTESGSSVALSDANHAGKAILFTNSAPTLTTSTGLTISGGVLLIPPVGKSLTVTQGSGVTLQPTSSVTVGDNGGTIFRVSSDTYRVIGDVS